MILQALFRLYQVLVKENKVARPGWCSAKVSYAIDLRQDGSVKGIIQLKKEIEAGKKKVWRPILLTVPEMVTRSSGVAANFLCDNSKYILGIDQDTDEKSKKKNRERFEAAREKHLSVLSGIEGDMAQAVYSFFQTWDPEKAQENEILKERWEEITDGSNLIFCMGMEYAQDDEEIKEAWARYRAEESGGVQGNCLVTGEKTDIARIHRGIKGVPGAQSSGAALVSFNAPAFESYGKEQSYNAPVGKYAEYAYTTALNYLLSQREYTMQIGDTMVAFWAESGEEAYQDAFFLSVEAPKDNQKELRGIFDKIRQQKFIDLDGVSLDPAQRFYVLGLAPNAARLSVRFFYENSFGEILENISRHYKRMEIIRPAWEENSYLGIRDLLFETVNKKSTDKKPVPNMAALTLKAVLSDQPYPASLYSNLLIRIRAEQDKGKINWKRAAALKAYLIRNYNWKEGDLYMGLKEDSQEIAYTLGRLFSVLESIQLDANPDINTTIRDKYFNSACASPASVFPLLIKLKNSHIRKIAREKEGSKRYYEMLLTEIMGKIDAKDAFPQRLSLEEQGKFILGYYHQTQKKYEKREEK